MYDMPQFFEIIYKNRNISGWKNPKEISEGITYILCGNQYIDVDNTFYNKFFRGTNKGAPLVEMINDEINELSFSIYIEQCGKRFKNINDRNNKFDVQVVANELLDCIEEATNLTGDIRQGLVNSYTFNHSQNIYLFLAESLYYAFKIQNNRNATYLKIGSSNIISGILNDKEYPWMRIVSQKDLDEQQFSVRSLKNLQEMTDEEIDALLLFAKIVLYDNEMDGYYIYVPKTDDELNLYGKYDIEYDTFLKLRNANLLAMDVPTTDQAIISPEYFSGFQNDHLVLVMISSDTDIHYVKYSTFPLSEFGNEFIDYLQLEQSRTFIIDLGRVLKKKIKKEPIKIGVFTVEYLEFVNEPNEIDWQNDHLS